MSGFVGTAPTIAVLDGSANIDLSTQLDDSLGTIRGAASTDGKDIWFTTGINDFKGGLFYTEKGGSSATRLIAESTGTNFCAVHIIDSTLFMNNERNYVDPYYLKSSLWYQSQLVKTLTGVWNTTVVASAPAGTVLRGMALAPKGGVQKLAQTIANFSDLTLTDQDADFNLTTTANSGLDILYGSLDNSVVSINGKTLHVGTCCNCAGGCCNL